jgi:hypothetical protein
MKVRNIKKSRTSHIPIKFSIFSIDSGAYFFFNDTFNKIIEYLFDLLINDESLVVLIKLFESTDNCFDRLFESKDKEKFID